VLRFYFFEPLAGDYHKLHPVRSRRNYMRFFVNEQIISTFAYHVPYVLYVC